jgi:hypothetical protein
VNAADIEAQAGAAGGLWTHAPVDWAGNEGNTRPPQWPSNASQGYKGEATGSRPGQTAFVSQPPVGGVAISDVQVYSIGATNTQIRFVLGSVPTSCRVNYGTTPAVASNIDGTATAGQQTINLTPLVTKTLYYFSVQATNANGTTVTSQGTFTTI